MEGGTWHLVPMTRSDEQQLDVGVATRLCGFRWVRWSKDALYRRAPGPGRASGRAEKVWR